MVTIKNSFLTVKIAKLGAEIKSIQKNGIENIWYGIPEIWSGTAPILFPVCGGLKDNKFIFEGKEYTLGKHGYAKDTLFEVESLSDTSVTFLHKSNEATRVSYPFDYEFRAIFSLCDSALKVEYRVTNLSGKTMYFNVGAHEAYYTPEGIEDYDLIFDEEETLETTMLYSCFVTKFTTPLLKESKVFPLYEKHFILDTLIFQNCLKSRGVTLRNRVTGRAIRVDFPDCDNLMLWHAPASPYICIEPWNGIPDVVGSSYALEEKEGITSLEDKKTYSNTHTITIY